MTSLTEETYKAQNRKKFDDQRVKHMSLAVTFMQMAENFFRENGQRGIDATDAAAVSAVANAALAATAIADHFACERDRFA